MGNVLQVEISSGEVVATLGKSRARFPIRYEARSREALERAMLLALKRTLAALSPKGKVKQIIAIVSSPWVITRKGLVIKELNSVASVEHEVFAKEKIAEETFVSAISKGLAWKIENEFIRSIAAKGGLVFKSSLAHFYEGLHKSFDIRDSILLNVGDSTTEALFLSKSGVSSAIFRFGPKEISTALAKKLDLPEIMAESYLSSYAEGDFSQEIRIRIDQALDEAEIRWREIWGEREELHNVYLRAPRKTCSVIKAFVQGVLPRSKILIYNQDNA